MEKQNPVIEPNFDGEPMRMPTVQAGRPIETTATTSILSLPIIILLTLILVAILGGFYYWYTLVMKEAAAIPVANRPTAEQNNEPESPTAEARTETTDVVSTSDELTSIRADIDSTHLEDLDNEIPAIESELNAALPGNP
jgi:flagellar basal body-associated protein FliL